MSEELIVDRDLMERLFEIIVGLGYHEELEIDQLLSATPPINAGQGEAVEVVAHLILGGIFDGREHGDIDYQIEPDVAERLQQQHVVTAEDVQLELMTVSQHERIVAAITAPPATTGQDQSEAVALAVWYGSMPESNGKSNYTAILHRKGERMSEGITLDRSEHPDRVRYEADLARFLIGELNENPFILDYDADKRSDYTAPPATGVIVPRELLDDEGLEAIQEWAEGEDQTVNIGQVQGDFDEHIESTAGYAVRLMKKLRALLAQSQEVQL